MADTDGFPPVIGGELLLMLWAVIRLRDQAKPQRALISAYPLIPGCIAALVIFRAPSALGVHLNDRSYHQHRSFPHLG